VLSLTAEPGSYILLFLSAGVRAAVARAQAHVAGLRVRAVSRTGRWRAPWACAPSGTTPSPLGLGSGIAGIAGVALSQLTNVGPNLGQAYIVDSFMVVVSGVSGNLWGTLNRAAYRWASPTRCSSPGLAPCSQSPDPRAHHPLIQKRPRGLFPQRGRAPRRAEDGCCSTPSKSDHGGQALLAVLAVAVVLVPVLNLAVPPDNPLHLFHVHG